MLTEWMFEYTLIKCRYPKATSQVFPRSKLWSGWSTYQPEISKAFQLCAPADQKFIMCCLCAKGEYIQTATMFISKYFRLSGGILFLSKTILLIHSLCIYWDRWCMRCITGILHQGICRGMRGYPADIDLAELCFWLPWQISSKWKLITLM